MHRKAYVVASQCWVRKGNWISSNTYITQSHMVCME